MLTDKALEVLRKINEQGLDVLHSYRVPYPRYGRDYNTGHPMPDAEWDVLKRELEHMEEKSEYMVYSQYRKFQRQRLEHGIMFNEKGVRLEDGTEKVFESVATFESQYKGLSDQVLNEVVTEHSDGQWMHYSVRISEWLTIEKVDMGEYFEEFVGIIERYTLTDKAREIIGIHANP